MNLGHHPELRFRVWGLGFRVLVTISCRPLGAEACSLSELESREFQTILLGLLRKPKPYVP